MNPDGTGVTRLTNIPDREQYDPSWSPDGAKLAFDSSSGETHIYTIDADGTNQSQLTSNAFSARYPSWSPDGTKLAFESFQDVFNSPEIYTMNADGTNPTRLTVNSVADQMPSWSPDGTKIAFVSGRDGNAEIYVMNADGTGQARLTNDASADLFPNWSPDGGRIVFATNRNPHYEIYTMNADGTGLTRLTDDTNVDWNPGWSPDGRKIIFERGNNCGPNEAPPSCTSSDVYLMDPDGSDMTALTSNPGNVFFQNPDWQPILLNYARPRGASPFLAHLVPAYQPCTSPNRTHGSPLAFPSCNPPAQRSAHLTLGTPDANGLPVNGIASVFLATRPADVNVGIAIRDVRQASDLADYTGELEMVADLRITDRQNTPHPGGPGPGTVQDTPLRIPVTCTATTATNLGSDCSLTTTVNTLYPGAVVPDRRSVWQLGQVQVYDGGPDGVASTTAGNTLFLTQGLFVP